MSLKRADESVGAVTRRGVRAELAESGWSRKNHGATASHKASHCKGTTSEKVL